jgi:hypothetical protein
MVLEYGAFVAAAVSKYCASCMLFYPCVWNVHMQRVPAHHDKSIYWSGYFLGRIARLVCAVQWTDVDTL